MKKLEDYTKEEVQRFDEIDRILTAYNKKVMEEGESAVLDKPPFTAEEVMAYSRYRQLLMARELGRN